MSAAGLIESMRDLRQALRAEGAQPYRKFGRFELLRRMSSREVVTDPRLLRRRGLRVVALADWLLIYTPRGHWSESL